MTQPTRLHLGCFDRIVSGWLNTDITPHLWIARIPLLPRLVHAAGMMSPERLEQHRRGIFRNVHYLDVRKRFPYPDSTFEAAFSSHFLEHLFPDDARHCLSEVHRVLRPGGICRIVVPDLDLIVSRYDPSTTEPFLRMIFEEPGAATKNAHHWHYNALSLTEALRQTGFREAYRCAYREGSCPDLELLDNRPEDSLYVEGIK